MVVVVLVGILGFNVVVVVIGAVFVEVFVEVFVIVLVVVVEVVEVVVVVVVNAAQGVTLSSNPASSIERNTMPAPSSSSMETPSDSERLMTSAKMSKVTFTSASEGLLLTMTACWLGHGVLCSIQFEGTDQLPDVLPQMAADGIVTYTASLGNKGPSNSLEAPTKTVYVCSGSKSEMITLVSLVV